MKSWAILQPGKPIIKQINVYFGVDMEINENPKQKDLRQAVVRLISNLLSGPFLPTSLLVLLALIVLTDYAYVLMREPLVYWYDYSRESITSLGWFQYGPFVAIGVYLVYIVVVWVILRNINRRVSIVIWSGLLVWHLSTFIIYPPTCNYDMLRLLPDQLCFIHPDIFIFVIGAIVGLVLSTSFFQAEKASPSDETPSGMQTRLGVSRSAVIVSISWLILLAIGVGLASRTPTTGWRPILTEHSPEPRYETMIAYNTQLGKGILFGGSVEISENNWTKVNDTWEWDGKDWIKLDLEVSPAPRARGAMAYDSKRNVIVLFGGWNNLQKSMNDTWEWDGITWKEVANCDTCMRPPARGCHNMYYDALRESVIVYGGCNENQYFFNDAWSWDGGTWSRVDVVESPVASGAPIVYDVSNQRAVGFLAWQPSGTWIWDKNGWSKPALTLEPPLRGNSIMAHDPSTGNSLMFGGIETKDGKTNYYLDTWVFNGTSWSKVDTASFPRGRWGHVIFFDTKLNKFLLFGGFDGVTALSDLWEIDASPNLISPAENK